MSHGNRYLDDQVSSTGDSDYVSGLHLADERRAYITLDPISAANDVISWSNSGPPQRTIVAGSRAITDISTVEGAIHLAPNKWWRQVPSELVHGGAIGVDTLAEEIGRRDGSSWDVVSTFDPRWNKYGPKAGPVRNTAMAEYADALIAVWDGQSDGTRDMIDTALDKGLNVYVHQVED